MALYFIENLSLSVNNSKYYPFFHGTRGSHDADDNEKVHKSLTFVVSILRACTLCYTTIRVHENSKNVLDILYAVPTVSYSEEVDILKYTRKKVLTFLIFF